MVSSVSEPRVITQSGTPYQKNRAKSRGYLVNKCKGRKKYFPNKKQKFAINFCFQLANILFKNREGEEKFSCSVVRPVYFYGFLGSFERSRHHLRKNRFLWQPPYNLAANLSGQPPKNLTFPLWCRRRESNPHTLRYTILSRARLPIPPLRLFRLEKPFS